MTASLKTLWKEYRKSNSEAVRQELLERYLPLVRNVVSRLTLKLPCHMDNEDLVGYGIFGLIDAIEKFDPSREVKFETYASRRIRGAILDEVRKSFWAPRSVTDKIKQVSRAYEKLEQKQGEEPISEETVAAETGLQVKEVQQTLWDASYLSTVSLEQFLLNDEDNSDLPLFEKIADRNSPDPAQVLVRKELKEALSRAINFLGKRDKLILALYYYEELTLKEIGKVLDISESRVSQLRGRALLRLRSKLKELL